MTQLRYIVGGVLALCVLVVVLQNTEPVDTHVLFYTLTLPRAFLLAATFIVGFVVGALWTVRSSGRGKQ